MSYGITAIEGISADNIRRLKKVGITTTDHLLAKAHDPNALGQLALQADIAEKFLGQWVAMASLMRVKGIGSQYSELLLAVGVDSRKKLLTMEPRELVRMMEEQKKARKLAGGVPKLVEVEQWLNELRTPAFAHAK